MISLWRHSLASIPLPKLPRAMPDHRQPSPAAARTRTDANVAHALPGPTVFTRQNPLTNHKLGFALHGLCLRSAQSVGKNILRSKLARVAWPIFRCGCTTRKDQPKTKCHLR
jgi:hypothetical protein